jgi:hypothetical protein
MVRQVALKKAPSVFQIAPSFSKEVAVGILDIAYGIFIFHGRIAATLSKCVKVEDMGSNR